MRVLGGRQVHEANCARNHTSPLRRVHLTVETVGDGLL